MYVCTCTDYTHNSTQTGLHTGLGAGGEGGGGGGGDELPKVLGGQCNMGVYWCTETVLIQ